MSCAIVGCPNHSGIKRKQVDGITFHVFPTDPEKKKAWLLELNRPDWTPNKYSKICSIHFEETSFYQTKKGYRKLRQDVSPKLYLRNEVCSDAEMTEVTHNLRSNIQVHSDDVETVESLQTSASISDEKLQRIKVEKELDPFLKFPDTPRKKKPKNELVHRKYAAQEKNINVKKLRAWNRRLKRKVESVQQLLHQLLNRNLIFTTQADLLRSINLKAIELVYRQIDKPLGKRVPKKYSANLRTFALTLNFYCPKAYDYIRNTYNTCLPPPGKIAKWYQTVNGNPGFTEEAFKILKLKSEESEHPIICNLVMNEMAINRNVGWDGSKYYGYVDIGANIDTDVLNEATEALVFMLVGVNGEWKLPVGYFLIDSVTGEQRASIVKKCLINAHNAGVKVIGLTVDGCPSNLIMMKILGCSLDTNDMKTYFKHPCSAERVYIFLDPCHMIKLIRYAFQFYKTFYDHQGNAIEWKYLQTGNKLTDKHINCHREKIRVKLATQLFSRSVANALESSEETSIELKEVLHTVCFIKVVNDLFDILNSKNMKQNGIKKPMHEGNSEKILSFLLYARNYITRLSTASEPVIRSRRKTGFLGLIICIDSAIGLYKSLVEEKQYIVNLPLHKFSQDHLEFFYCNIKAHGGTNNDPTARQFRAVYKKTVINTELKEGGNCTPLESIGILSCSSSLSTADMINSTSDRYRILEVDSDTDNDDVSHRDALELFESQKLIENEYSNTTQVVTYIAGYIVQTLQQQIKCEHCILALHASEQTDAHRLIILINREKLTLPSNDVIKISLRTECILKNYKKSYLNTKRFNTKCIVYATQKSLIGENCFTELSTHAYDQHPIFNHVNLLIKAIIQQYCSTRLNYYNRLENVILTRRCHLNKTLLFSGQ